MLGWRLIPSLAGLNAKPAVNGEGHDRGSHSKGQDVGDALFHGSVVSGALPLSINHTTSSQLWLAWLLAE